MAGSAGNRALLENLKTLLQLSESENGIFQDFPES
jgi:hypothetical protein